MKKIVVPIDFSESSKNAVAVAAQIAKATGAEIVFAHWYNRAYVGSFSSMTTQVSAVIDNKQEEAYKTEFNQGIKELVKENGLENVKVKIHLYYDKSVVDVFSTKEINEGTDLIIMGTAGASNMKELFVGSNTQKVVRYAEAPVLAIKEKFDITSVNDLIFASDFKDEKCENAFKKIHDLVKAMNVKTHLLKVITPTYFEDSDTSDAKVSKFIQNTGIQNYVSVVYNNFSPEEGISDYSKKFENSVVCMATNGFKGFAHLMSGSISEDLVNRLNKPILTVKM